MKKNVIEMKLILGLILVVFVFVAGYKFFNRESQNTKLIYIEGMRQPIIQIAFNSHGQLLNFANSFERDVGREISF